MPISRIGAKRLQSDDTAGADILAVQQRLEGLQDRSVGRLGKSRKAGRSRSTSPRKTRRMENVQWRCGTGARIPPVKVLKNPVEGGFFGAPGPINGRGIGDAEAGVAREEIRETAGIRFGWIARQPAYARHGKTLTSCGTDPATDLTARRAFEPTIFPERLRKRTFGGDGGDAGRVDGSGWGVAVGGGEADVGPDAGLAGLPLRGEAPVDAALEGALSRLPQNRLRVFRHRPILATPKLMSSEVHSAQEGLKAGVGTDGIKEGFPGQVHNRHRIAFFVHGFLRELEGTIPVVESGPGKHERF